MERRTAANQIELGSYVYLFVSPVSGMRDCVISAHGGHVQGRQFKIPSGISVSFQSSFGRPVIHSHGPIRSAMTGQDESTQTFSGPRAMTDQLLGKSLGTHWDDPNNRDGVQYYEFVQQHQQSVSRAGQGSNWAPHFISVRNRKFPFANHLMWLSNVIELVQKYDASIVNFHSAACRGVVPDALAKKAGKQSYPV